MVASSHRWFQVIKVWGPCSAMPHFECPSGDADDDVVINLPGLRVSPFTSSWAGLEPELADYDGFALPVRYGGFGAHTAARHTAVIIDLSSLRKIDIVGPDAVSLLDEALTRAVHALRVGRVMYSAMCNDAGGLIDDPTVFRLGTDHFWMIASSDDNLVALQALAQRRGFDVSLTDITDAIANLAVQGPASTAVVAKALTSVPLYPSVTDLKWFDHTVCALADLPGLVRVSRTGFTGEVGYELWCAPEHAPALWKLLMRAGQAEGLAGGLVACGTDTLNVLRIEAGFPVMGDDFDDTTTPFELGIGFTVDADIATGRRRVQGGDALRGALRQQCRVGLFHGGHGGGDHGLAAPGAVVERDGRKVGRLTSSAVSPTLGAIGFVLMHADEVDDNAEVMLCEPDGTRVRAHTCPLPFAPRHDRAHEWIGSSAS